MDVNNLTSAERETIIFEVLMMLRKSIPNIVRKTGILINQAQPVSIEDRGSYFRVTAYVRAVDYANKYIFLGPYYLNAKREGDGWAVDKPEFDSGIDGCYYDVVGVNASHLKVYSHMVVIDEKALYLCDCASVSVTDASEGSTGTIRFDMKDGTSDTFVWDLTTQNIDFMNNFKTILDTMVSNAEPFDREPVEEEPAGGLGPRSFAEEAPAARPAATRPAASAAPAAPASQAPFRPSPSPSPVTHASAPAFKHADDSEEQSAFRTVGNPDKKRGSSFLHPHHEKAAPSSVEEEFDSFLKEDASTRPVFKPVFQNQAPEKEAPKAAAPAPSASSSPFKPLGGASEPAAPAASSPFKPIGSTPEPAAPAANSPFKPLGGAPQSSAPAANSPFKPIGSAPEPAAPAANSPFKPIGSAPEPAAPAANSPFKPLGGASQSSAPAANSPFKPIGSAPEPAAPAANSPFKPLGGGASQSSAPASNSPFKPLGGSSEPERSPFAPASNASRPSARPAASSQPSGNPNFQSPFSSAAQNTKTTEDGTVLKPMTAESLAHIDDLKPVRSVVSSPEEEVEKYRRLLSIGAITADEFELKKRQLIGD